MGGRISADANGVAPRFSHRKPPFRRHPRDRSDAAFNGKGAGTPDDPWRFTESAGTADSIAFRDNSADPPEIVVRVGGAEYRYHVSWLEESRVPLASGHPPNRRQGLRGQLDVYARSLLATLGLNVSGEPPREV